MHLPSSSIITVSISPAQNEYAVLTKTVLPSRLKQELSDLADAIIAGKDIAADAVLGKHADWIQEIRTRETFTPENTMDILLQETGRVFSEVLEDAGVYKCTPEGRAAFLRFTDSVFA